MTERTDRADAHQTSFPAAAQAAGSGPGAASVDCRRCARPTPADSAVHCPRCHWGPLCEGCNWHHESTASRPKGNPNYARLKVDKDTALPGSSLPLPAAAL